MLSYVFTRHNPQAYYYMRHLCIFGTFLLGVWGVYYIGRVRFRDWRLGLLAALLLVLSPRLFAEAFFNGKDIMFLGVFTLAMATLVRLTERPTWQRAVLHGLAIGLAIDARILGSILVPFTVVLVLLDDAPQRRHQLRLLGCCLVAAMVMTVVGWPYLWENPLGHFVAAFRNLSHYPWSFTNFYLGHFHKVADIPWHYGPVWILVTTPLPYVVAALGGLVTVAIHFIRRGWLAIQERGVQLDSLLVGWLLGPLLLVIALHSALYDSWRHLYFVYPALVLLAVRGAVGLAAIARQSSSGRRVTIILALLAGLETVHTAVRMVRLHPYQNLYFSCISAPTAERLFERDYWGLTFRHGIEWMLQHQPTGPIRVYVRWPWYNPLYNNTLILRPEQRQRIRYVPLAEADYFITAYRWHPQTYADSMGTEIHTLHTEGIKVLSIFRQPSR
nr:glycosyltransferase family 39 protein [Hymenobacter sp. AT01-02]